MFDKVKKIIVVIMLALTLISTVVAQDTAEHELIVSVERIWDRATHNAFTGLLDYNGTLYCSFRESNGHVSDINGSIRVIASDDGQNWYSVAHIFERGADLRDPQISITPDNRIMLNIAGSIYTNGKLEKMIPKVSFSDPNGKNFSAPQKVFIDKKVGTDMDWLWRATWHKGKSYATIYQPSKEKSVQLLISDDGINYKFVTTFDVIGGNETTLRFTSDNKMVAVVRRDRERPGFIGVSGPPYKDWNWNELEERLGGPELIILENGDMLCATREYPKDHNEKTIIAKVEFDGTFIKLLTLPSGGDCSYPGFVLRDGLLYVSYYSSHEEKTAIYLAKIVDLKYGFKSFERAPTPFVSMDEEGIVKLSCKDSSAKIKFTLDGSMPSAVNGYTYKEKIKVDKTSLLRAVSILDKRPISKTLSQNVGVYIFQKAQAISKDLQSGLKYAYYEGKTKTAFKLDGLMKTKDGISPVITSVERRRDENYAFKFSGFVEIPEDGSYTFYLTSNDGSYLSINDKLVINNDGAHGKREETVELTLSKGYHKIDLSYFQLGGGQVLKLEWSGDKFNKVEIPASRYFN